MRLISWCSLSLPYLRVLHALSHQNPPAGSSVLSETRNIPPLFFPTAHSGSLLAIFGRSTPGTSNAFPSLARSASVPPSSAELTTEKAKIEKPVRSTVDIPDYTPTSSWEAPKFFDDLSPFNITHFASGRRNLEIVVGIIYDLEGVTYVGDPSPWASWTDASTMLQLFYPKDSINPAQRPQGGSEFYAAPLDLRNAYNVTLVYSILFPSDFEWVKGGKLPGLYGGHTRCSGGDDAFECFSTRLMWRADGDGELYLYAPKDRQTASLCNAPPLSICDTTFGLSIARGSFQFARGSWTHLRQTVVLNTPGVQDGGFLLEVDGNPVIDRADVLYRDAREYPAPEDPDYPPTPSQPSQPEDGGGLLGTLLGDLLGAGFGSDTDGEQASSLVEHADASTILIDAVPCDSLAQQNAQTGSSGGGLNQCARHVTRRSDDEPIGFKGIFFSTFFGGHDEEFATPKDQFVWFKDFAIYINS